MFRHLSSVLPDATFLFTAGGTPDPTLPQGDATDLYGYDPPPRHIPSWYLPLVRRLLWIDAHPPPELLQQCAFEWRLYFLAVLGYAHCPRLFVRLLPIPQSHLICPEALPLGLYGHFARHRAHFVCSQQPRRTGAQGNAADTDPLYTVLRRAWPHQCQLKHFRRRLMSLFNRTSDPPSVSATDFVCRAQILFALGMYRHVQEPTTTTGGGKGTTKNSKTAAKGLAPLPPLADLRRWVRAWVSPDGHSDLHALALGRAPSDFMDWIWALRELMVFMMETDAAFHEWLTSHTDWTTYRQLITDQCRKWRLLGKEATQGLPVPVDQRCTVSVAGDFWLALHRCFGLAKVPVPTIQPFWVYQMARLHRFNWRLFPLMQQAHRYVQGTVASATAGTKTSTEEESKVPATWLIPSKVLVHEQGRYLRQAHVIHCIFERLSPCEPKALEVLLHLLQLHCGPRLSDTARHNRNVAGLNQLAELDPTAYALLYSLCVGMDQALRTTVMFWPRSIVDAQYHQLWVRAQRNTTIVTEASHIYVCPCCMEIHSMVQKSGSRRVSQQPIRAFTSTSVSGMQRTCIDLIEDKLYCARKNGKKARQCHQTPLVAFPLLGVLLHFSGKSYTLCVQCGIPCEYTGLRADPPGPHCMACVQSK